MKVNIGTWQPILHLATRIGLILDNFNKLVCAYPMKLMERDGLKNLEQIKSGRKLAADTVQSWIAQLYSQVNLKKLFLSVKTLLPILVQTRLLEK